MKMNSIQTGALGISELQGLVCSWSSLTRRKEEGGKNVESIEEEMRSDRAKRCWVAKGEVAKAGHEQENRD